MANLLFIASLAALAVVTSAFVVPKASNSMALSSSEGKHHHGGKDKFVLAMGGLNGQIQDTVFVYSEAKKTWATGKTLPYVLYGFGVSLLNFHHAEASVVITGGDSTDNDFADPIATTLLLNISKAHNGNPVKLSWEQSKVKDLPVARDAFAQATVGNKVYVFGGQTGDQEFTATGASFNPKDNKWKKTADMPAPARAEVGAAALGDHVYVMGGYDGSAALGEALAYDTRHNKWKSIANMNVARIGAAATAGHNGKVYCGGGQISTEERFASVEEYDPKKNTWTLLTESMSTKRAYMGFTTLSDGKLLACGGVAAQYWMSCEGYDPAHPNKGWVTFPPMPLGITGLSLIAVH